MINVSSKHGSLRYARAVGILKMQPETLRRVKENSVPKGDVTATARAAGISAAKRTSDWIVFCHPIPLDWVEISIEYIPEGLRMIAEVESVWKTGVEMEALAGVMGALMNAYDMLKPLDTEMSMDNIKVEKKTGGKSDFKDVFRRELKAAVLVISDSTFEGTRKDKSGLIIKETLESFNLLVDIYEILPDELKKIRGRVEDLSAGAIDLIITTGGTGFGPKDLTPEALSPILDKTAPGIVERLRGYGSDRTPYAMLSREIAGTIGSTLILTLPGSSEGARECLQALFPGVLHIFPMLWGGGHDQPEQSP